MKLSLKSLVNTTNEMVYHTLPHIHSPATIIIVVSIIA